MFTEITTQLAREARSARRREAPRKIFGHIQVAPQEFQVGKPPQRQRRPKIPRHKFRLRASAPRRPRSLADPPKGPTNQPHRSPSPTRPLSVAPLLSLHRTPAHTPARGRAHAPCTRRRRAAMPASPQTTRADEVSRFQERVGPAPGAYISTIRRSLGEQGLINQMQRRKCKNNDVSRELFIGFLFDWNIGYNLKAYDIDLLCT